MGWKRSLTCKKRRSTQRPSELVPKNSHQSGIQSQNPFPAGSLRHSEWRTATLLAEERHATLCAHLIGNPGSHIVVLEFTFAVCAFPIWAARGEAAIQSDAELKAFDKWLVDYADSFCVLLARDENADTSHQRHLEEIRTQLASQVQRFKGRAESSPEAI